IGVNGDWTTGLCSADAAVRFVDLRVPLPLARDRLALVAWAPSVLLGVLRLVLGVVLMSQSMVRASAQRRLVTCLLLLAPTTPAHMAGPAGGCRAAVASRASTPRFRPGA